MLNIDAILKPKSLNTFMEPSGRTVVKSMEAAPILPLAQVLLSPCEAHNSLQIVPHFRKDRDCFHKVTHGTRQRLALAVTKMIVTSHPRNEIKKTKISTRAKILYKTKSSMFCSLK